VALYAPDTGHQRLLGRHDRAVFCIVWHPLRSIFASASGDGTVRVWDVASGDHSIRLSLSRGILGLCQLPANDYLYSACLDGTVREISWVQGTDRILPGFDARVLAVHSSGTFLAGGRADGTIQLFDLQADRVTSELRGHGADLYFLGFGGDGHLYSRALDQTLGIWDVKQMHLLAIVDLPSPGSGFAPIALHPAIPDQIAAVTAGAGFDISVRECNPERSVSTLLPAFAGSAAGEMGGRDRISASAPTRARCS